MKAKKQKVAASKSIPMYPQEVRYRGGCKVSWLYYKDRATAEIASKVAIKDGVRQAERGYDFGYCSPGSIRETDDGLFEVCIP